MLNCGKVPDKLDFVQAEFNPNQLTNIVKFGMDDIETRIGGIKNMCTGG